MPAPKPSAIVVVPIYTTALSADARRSLQRTLSVLGHHPLAVICPEGLDLSPLQALLSRARASVERFAPEWFAGVSGYNRLMLSEAFYERFAQFDFVLICQTDVFVFEDRLEEWVTRNVDYVGAPWVASKPTIWRKALFRVNNFFRTKKKSDEYLFKVGNGGFSLRRVSMMRRIVRELRADIDAELANPTWRNYHVEDQYFSLVAPKKIPGGMNIPEWREAISFCIDRRPKLALQLNGGRLPFACHGFDKRNVRAFWRPILDRIVDE